MVCGDWCRKAAGCSQERVFLIIRAILSRWPRPTMASIPSAWLKSSRPNLCGRQPATITFFTRRCGSSLQATACFTASSASALAGAINPHVLMTTTSAFSGSAAISKPARAISANILSLSTIFLGQPNAIKPTVTFFRLFLAITR